MAISTKIQEKKAIKEIRKIVESLGENSYVGTAMEGVLEIAEENIESDAAFSLKNRAEIAEKEADSLKEENKNLRAELEHAEDRIKKLESDNSALQKCTVAEWALKIFDKLVLERLDRISSEMDETAEKMATSMIDGNSENMEKCAKWYMELKKERNKLSRVKECFLKFEKEE